MENLDKERKGGGKGEGGGGRGEGKGGKGRVQISQKQCKFGPNPF